MVERRDGKHMSCADERPSSASWLHVEAASLCERNRTRLKSDKKVDQGSRGSPDTRE